MIESTPTQADKSAVYVCNQIPDEDLTCCESS